MVNFDEEYKPIESFDLVGGALCLDFVNTGSARREGPFQDRLRAYADLVTWAERTEVLTAEEGTNLRAQADGDPAGAQKVLDLARELREAVYRAFSAQRDGSEVAAADLERISEAGARASAHRQLVATPEGVQLTLPSPARSLEHPVWAIAISALDLLTSDEAARVKECATDNCNWLFLDASKNRSRRWCEMKECGNRAKARRHYHRKRGQA
jgi:predicted RNA-binding Zn ribbon-like protein